MQCSAVHAASFTCVREEGGLRSIVMRSTYERATLNVKCCRTPRASEHVCVVMLLRLLGSVSFVALLLLLQQLSAGAAGAEGPGAVCAVRDGSARCALAGWCTSPPQGAGHSGQGIDTHVPVKPLPVPGGTTASVILCAACAPRCAALLTVRGAADAEYIVTFAAALDAPVREKVLSQALRAIPAAGWREVPRTNAAMGFPSDFSVIRVRAVPVAACATGGSHPPCTAIWRDA